MEKQRPPPGPGTSEVNGNVSNARHRSKRSPANIKRQAFGNRSRTFSSGSTRGAFGPITVMDAHKQHDEIHHMQNAAMNKNYRNINKKPKLPTEVRLGHSRGNGNSNNNNDISNNCDSDNSSLISTNTDEETGKINDNQYPLFRNQHKHQPTSPNKQIKDARRHERIPSSDPNTGFMFSHHAPAPTLEDLQHQAQKEKEMQIFASNATNGHGELPAQDGTHATNNDKKNNYAHYGSNEQNAQNVNRSWDQDDVSYRDQSFDSLAEEPSLLRYWFRTIFYDHTKPEFSSLQQTSWAILLGIFMGVLTAAWGEAVERSVDFVWVVVPKYLLSKGIFTDLDGHLPLPHYFWICPAIFGAILSYITAMYAEKNIPVPGQNEWIESLHRVGIMDHERIFPVIILSTLGMASGLSLGPEMPLVLTAGMVGSWLALKTKQSVLSSRVMNLVAASAAIGGFFGFPMAGALFVLELPHRMGLQYFEALSPCVIASIVSVITNRIITKKHVEGYFDYPFLAETLPSEIFVTVLIYGLVGTLVGVLYVEICLWCKHSVHDWFHVAHDDHDHGHGHEDGHGHDEGGHDNETSALMGGDVLKEGYYLEKKPEPGYLKKVSRSITVFFGIEHEPTRAALAGALVGILVGVICMFLPHQLFWGEAQLQTLIDKGKTPLPVFEYEGPTSNLTAYGYCMIDPEDEREQIQGFSTACMGMLSFTKILTIGLSLGTGICGGHFWGPLYVGCAAGHFFTDIMHVFKEDFDVAGQLSMFPCISILCFMGSTHVVTYRCHMAIMLVLTLTITAFTSETKEGKMAGDYAAIFPLLVVACFVPLIIARGTIFYGKQRCRGDIMAIPEVLCEPLKKGNYIEGDNSFCSYNEDDDSYYSHVSSGISLERDDNQDSNFDVATDNATDAARKVSLGTSPSPLLVSDGANELNESLHSNGHLSVVSKSSGLKCNDSDVPFSNTHVRKASSSSSNADPMNQSMHSTGNLSRVSRSSGRRRSNSQGVSAMSGSLPKPSMSRTGSFGSCSFGKVEDLQPNLLEQGRQSVATNLVPPKGHRRKGSNVSTRSASREIPTSESLDNSKHSVIGQVQR